MEKENMALKFWYCLQIALYAVGSIGGLGWTLYSKAWVTAVGVAALAAFALPYIKGVFKKLLA